MRQLFRLNKYFYRYRGRLAAGVLFVTVANIFGIIPAKLIRYALDDASEKIQWFGLTSDFLFSEKLLDDISFNLVLFAVAVLLMALLKGLFMFLMRQTIIVVSRHIEYDMKNDIFNHYQGLDQTFYSVNNTGDLMNRISEDVSRVRMYVGPAVMYTVNLVVMFVLVIWAMIRVNPGLTFYTLLPLPALALIIYYVEEIINRKSEKVQERLSGISTFVQEVFSGIRVLKSYSREQYFASEFKNEANRYQETSLQLTKVNALFHPSMVLLIGLSTILTVFVGGLKVMEGEITIGNIAEFVIYVNMLMWPVAVLGWVVSLIQRASASQKRINEFLDTVPITKSGNYSPEALKGEIEFRHVSYVYPNSGIAALKDVSFTIQPGTSVAITGGTGSGKSTIANLLLRFMDPEQGTILIDNHPLKDYNLDYFRSATGFVPQEVFLFSDTISANIAFGLKNKSADIALIEQAAKDAVIHDNITGFSEGYRTKVGERGITLSGGQKQRISIARAIIRKPSILMFDDCLSAVDTITEDRIITNLNRIMKGRTTIIISHRISSVKHADRILVLDQGRLAESGSHEELISAEGIYRNMYESQIIDKQGIE
jgi:ATP-binding cassette subfamily B multidrug efflux pump